MSEEKNDKKYIDSVTTVDTDSSSLEGGEGGDGGDRAAWGGQLEFILTCVGYAVGLGNVWRFPYLCYKNGGGAFLIPYITMLAFVGLPLFYMELCIGQFGSLGPLTIWKFNPIFKGLGFASVMVSLLISIYYNVIIAICIYFLFKSMTSKLPWTDCGNAWNTVNCRTLDDLTSEPVASNFTNGTLTNATLLSTTTAVMNITANSTSNATSVITTTPSEEFFYNYVLQLTDGMDVAGNMRWEIVGCLLFAWAIVALVLIRGISSLGKVVYFSALFPYVLLTILLVRGALLEGSLNGVIYYLNPQWDKLLEASVWSDAAVQIFYSLGVASGGLIAMASYNKFNNNCLRDSLIVPIINCGTSIYAGFVIFSVLGYMAKKKGVDVADVAAQGPGLTFVVYPEALSVMPLPPLWSILFFFMMMTLGFSSQFSMMECVLTSFIDEYPQWLKINRKREIMFRVGLCVFGFLCGLPMCTQGGFYVLNLVDNYVGGLPLIIVGIGELVAINWVYGFRRFNQDIKMMLGRKAPIFFMIMWCGFSPLLMAGCLVFTCIQYKPLVFQGWEYTPGFSAIGWLIVIFCVGFIPLFAIITCLSKGGWTVLKIASSPESDWGPVSAENRAGTKYETSYKQQTDEPSHGTSNGAFAISQMSIPPYDVATKL